MAQSSTLWDSCKSLFSKTSRYNKLARPTSTNVSTSTRLIAQISASGLVLASAGFGSVYAWSTGSQHGVVLGALMVVMAVALELAKPLSLAGAFQAMRLWSPIRAAALAILALVAISYSLTAELSLMATTRGDIVAAREASIHTASDIEADVKRARDRYELAKAELLSLPATRPSSELQAEIDGLLMTPGADGCIAINGKITRELCPKVSVLKAEKARADRRAELERIVAKPLRSSSSAKTDNGHAVSQADPAASALSAYLAFFGFTIAPAVLSEWLVLVGVLALEIGSAMAGVLVQSFAGSPVTAHVVQGVKTDVVQPNIAEPVQQVVHPAKTAVSKDVDHSREKVKTAIVSQLKAHGGSVSSGERGLAKLIGANRSTMRRAINGLVVAGVVAAEATRNGTMLRLVA